MPGSYRPLLRSSRGFNAGGVDNGSAAPDSISSEEEAHFIRELETYLLKMSYETYGAISANHGQASIASKRELYLGAVPVGVSVF